MSGRLLMIHFTSVNRALKGSSSRVWWCSRTSADKTDLTDRIWRSQTPPIWDSVDGFCFHWIIQSAPARLEIPLVLSLLSLMLVPDLIRRTGPLVAVNRRTAFMKESISNE